MQILKVTVCVCATALASCSSVRVATSPVPTTASISSSDVLTRIDALAADSMEGRDTGRRGGVRSSTYIAAELRRIGLEPAGDTGTFLQAIPWIRRVPDSAATLTVSGQTFRWGTDLLLLPKLGFALALGGQPFGAAFEGNDVPTIFGGRIGDSTVAPELARGKIVVFAPARDRPAYAFWQRDNLRRYRDARAIFVATLDLGAPNNQKVARETFWDSTTTGDATPLAVVSITKAVAERVFGRALDSVTVGSGGAPVSGRARFIDGQPQAPSYNVVGILRGRDAALRNSYVAVGAHHDHVGIGPAVDHDSLRAFNHVVRPRGADDPPPQNVSAESWAKIRHDLDSLRRIRPPRRDSIFNGADDDASGTALALEIAEALAPAANRPRRSIVFVFHTAEEKGLFGSQYYADHPTVPRDSIVAQINMDQMGRGGAADHLPEGPNALVLIGTRRLSRELGDLVERVNGAPAHGFKLDYSFDRNGDPLNAYCRSDHYMYARYNIPVAFFSAAAWHQDYHMVTDETQYVDGERTARIGRYINDVVAAVANLDHRPVIDGPKPDPNGLCRQ